MIKLKVLPVLWFGILFIFQSCEADKDIIDPEKSSAFRYYDKSNGLSHDNVQAMMMDDNGKIFVATYGGGVSIFESGLWSSIRKDDGLIDDRTYSLTFDKYGNLWVGTYSGISIVSQGGQVIQNITSINESAFKAHKLFRDSRGWIWIGVDEGFYVYDYYNPYFFDYGQGFIWAITEDVQGIVWLACAYGAIYYDEDKGFDLYTLEFNGYPYGVGAIMEDTDNYLWFGLMDLDKAVMKTGSGKKFINLYNADIVSITEDSKNNIWFTTFNSGVVRYDGVEAKSFGIPDGLTDLSVPCSLVDSNGDVWFGTTGGGICIYVQK